jgi:hypothetical protein
MNPFLRLRRNARAGRPRLHLPRPARKVFSSPHQKPGYGISYVFEQNPIFGAEGIFVIALHTKHSHLTGR